MIFAPTLRYRSFSETLLNRRLVVISYQRWSRGHKARSQRQGHKKIRGQGQGHKRECSPKKKVFTEIFQAISTKKRFPKNFNNSKNSAVLEPRTGRFSRTRGQRLQNVSSRTPPLYRMYLILYAWSCRVLVIELMINDVEYNILFSSLVLNCQLMTNNMWYRLMP